MNTCLLRSAVVFNRQCFYQLPVLTTSFQSNNLISLLCDLVWM